MKCVYNIKYLWTEWLFQISHTSKIMLRVIQYKLQPYMGKAMFKMDFEKSEEHKTLVLMSTV